MKKLFGIAMLALPLLAGSAHANGWPFNIQASGSFHISGSRGPSCPQAGPWYLYWPLEAHFVAPAPTGYPYWPSPQGLPATTFGGPAFPPPVAPPPVAQAPVVALPPVSTVPPPSTTTPPPQAPTLPPLPSSTRQVPLPPYLQPTSYYPSSYTPQPPSYYPSPYTTQPPSYWYDR